MPLTRGEAQEIYDMVMDVMNKWISGSDRRNRGGAGINEAALKTIRNEMVQKLKNHFASKDIEVLPN